MINNNIINSEIAKDAKIYKNVRILNSVINECCCIGDDCDIENSYLYEKSELGRRNLLRNVTIGKGSYTGTNSIIKNTTIGKYCDIGWNVSIGGGFHNYNNVSMYSDYWYKRTFNISNFKNNENDKSLECHIGNDVWIGSGVNILGGVTIGDGSVIGAGAVIVKDVDPYSVVAGVPGKTIKKRFDDDIINDLLRLKWWDWDEDKIVSEINFLRNKPNKSIIIDKIKGR